MPVYLTAEKGVPLSLLPLQVCLQQQLASYYR